MSKSPIGFVYIWRDQKHRMYYIGSHIGRENDGYIASSSRFKRAFNKRPQNFKRRIIERVYSDNSRDVRIAEQHWLDMIKSSEVGVRYYNLNRAALGFDRETARKAGLASANALTPEERSARGHKAGAAAKEIMTFEQRSEAGRKGGYGRATKLSAAELSAIAAKGGTAGKGSKKTYRVPIIGLRSGLATRTPEQQKDAQRKGGVAAAAKMTPEQRIERSAKMLATRWKR